MLSVQGGQVRPPCDHGRYGDMALHCPRYDVSITVSALGTNGPFCRPEIRELVSADPVDGIY